MQVFENDIEECLKVLKNGGIILYPTDTIWGIGCDATNEKAVRKIYRLKKRLDKRTMIILVANESDVLQYVNQPGRSLFDYLQQSIKPTTVIYKYAGGLAESLVAKDGTIAIRISKESFCSSLIEDFGKPIVSTSANISGKKAPMTFSEISDEIKKGVDYIVRYRQEDMVPSVPSTVIRWENEQPVIIRS